MAIIEGGVSAALLGVGAEAANAAHVCIKPIPHGALGHYRTTVKLTMATSQGANSRLFEIRNTGTNIIIPTRIRVGILPTGTVTASFGMELGLFRCTAFTAVDTTNTVTPTTSVMRTAGMVAYPGGAAVRHNTIAGAAAGMTGGTLTKDAQAIANLISWAATAGASTVPVYGELMDPQFGGHPLVLAQNEGFEIENVVVGSATANVIQVVINVAWAEATAY